MGHHGVVDEHHAQALVVTEMHGRGPAEFDSIDRPRVAFHVAGEMQLDFPPRPPTVKRTADRVQIGIGQDAPPVVAQTHARVVEVGAGRVHAHVHARAVFGPGMVRARHAGHVAHHVLHFKRLRFVQHGHRRRHAGARRQRAARVAGAVHRLGEDRVSLVPGRDDHVVGLGHADADLVHRHRLDVLAIGLDHSHLETRYANVEEGHRATVDEAQPHLFAWMEQPGPVAGRSRAVHQIGVGIARDVGEIGRAHAHLVPHLAVVERGFEPVVRDVAEEVRNGGLVEVVVVALRLELGKNPHRIFVGPVGQLHHVIAVGTDRLAASRLDDDGAVDAGLFLHAGMRVVPVGAGLPHLESIGEGFPRGDALVADPRYTVHLKWQEDAVPVDGAVNREPVGNPNGHGISLAPAQRGCRKGTIDGGGHARCAGEIDRRFRNREIKFGSAEYRSATCRGIDRICPGRLDDCR